MVTSVPRNLIKAKKCCPRKRVARFRHEEWTNHLRWVSLQRPAVGCSSCFQKRIDGKDPLFSHQNWGLREKSMEDFWLAPHDHVAEGIYIQMWSLSDTLQWPRQEANPTARLYCTTVGKGVGWPLRVWQQDIAGNEWLLQQLYQGGPSKHYYVAGSHQGAESYICLIWHPWHTDY